MKLSVQYLSDNKGNIKSVQLPLTEWEKIMLKIKNYEQILKIKSDLTEALSEVKKLQRGEIKKQTLSSFLHEL